MIRFIDLGIIPYEEAVAMQEAALEDVCTQGPERVFLLEHPPTVTLGRRAGAEHLLVPEPELARRGVALIRSERGGDITCHYPGQMVAYPIMRIHRRPGGLKRYFHDLEESVIRTLDTFGITAGRVPDRTGVWVDGHRKICSMGVAVRHWVAWHGLSLNVGRDVSLFQTITMCGLADAVPASVQTEAGDFGISVEDVKHAFIRAFGQVFEDSALASGQVAHGQGLPRH